MSLKHIAVVIVTIAFAVPAAAAPITFVYSGTLTSVDPALASVLHVGDPFSGSYTFESTTPSDGFDPGTRENYLNAVTAHWGTVGSYSYTFNPLGGLAYYGFPLNQSRVEVANNYFPDDSFGFVATATGLAIGPQQLRAVGVFGYDASQSMLSGTALPLTPPGPLSSSFFLLKFFQDGDPFGVNALGTFDTFEVPAEPSAVPEPTTLLLVGSGLAAAARRRRRTTNA
ncbi:MAG: PEP-CTERM sorting domain-containing protein [Chloroflexi bacterium]|nr:PEP-CTERM sorting domain-containing protein [Chloroflexota bacterium]